MLGDGIRLADGTNPMKTDDLPFDKVDLDSIRDASAARAFQKSPRVLGPSL